MPLGLQEIVPDRSGSGTSESYLRVDEGFTAPVLQDVLPEGLPVPSAVLLLADPGAGKEQLTLELLSTRLRVGYKVLWISLENFPNALRATFEFSGFDTTTHGSLEFVDCYSSQVGVKSTERYSADPSNLPNLSVAASLAVSKLSQDAHLVVMLDSLSSLVQMAGARAAIEFFRTLVGKARSVRADLLTTLNRKAFSPTILASVQEMVDGVLELRLTDDQTDVCRYLRIRKMLGRKYDSVSIPYDVDQERGILRRIDSGPVRLSSSLSIEVNEQDRVDDLAALPLYTSTNGTDSALLEPSTLGREEDIAEKIGEARIFADHEMVKRGLSPEELVNPPRLANSSKEPLRAIMGRPLPSKRNGLSRAILRESQTMTEPASVESALLSAIDDGLLALGEVVRDTIYDRFDRKYQLKHDEIPQRMDVFHEALQGMLGAGARVIETQIAKIFDNQLNLEFTEDVNWTIVDYFDSAKRTKARVSE
jgi:KaiC/GvpD/RAD55 family RecA-like ATPase